MKIENISSILLDEEYVRTVSAARIASAVCICLAAAWCASQYWVLGAIYEPEYVLGGKSRIPWATHVAMDNGKFSLVAAIAAAVISVGFIWIGTRRLSQILHATVVGAGVCATVGILFSVAVAEYESYFFKSGLDSIDYLYKEAWRQSKNN